LGSTNDAMTFFKLLPPNLTNDAMLTGQFTGQLNVLFVLIK